MCRLLQEVRRQTGVTTLHVTHHEPEALTLASDLFRIEDGRIVSQSRAPGSQNRNTEPTSSSAARP